MSLEQWEAYYRRGSLATGPAGADGAYDLEVREAWAQFFSMLPREARILDIGTGNGVIALIAAETARSLGCDWDIHATDLANIDPAKHVRDGASRLAGIHFHPGVATEQLPFENGSFDAVSGHYALEYADTAKALAEIHRVLKPGGEAQFIVHNADSLLVRSARLSLREADFVFRQAKAYRRVHRLVSMEQAAADTVQRATQELRATIQALKQAQVQARKAGGGLIIGVTLDAIQKLLSLRKTVKPQAAGLEVDRAENELRTSMRRLQDLIAHARDEQAISTIEAQAAEAGFTAIERQPQLHAGDHLVGWRIEMRKP